MMDIKLIVTLRHLKPEARGTQRFQSECDKSDNSWTLTDDFSSFAPQ